MLKFFRKYNKLILVVGGSLLMIAFLVPQALQQVGQAAAGRAVVKFDGGSYSVRDLQRAEAELNAIATVTRLDPAALGIEGNEHWLLLVAEARRAGFRGGRADAEALLNQVAGAYAQQYVQQTGGQIGIDEAFAQIRNDLLQNRARAAGGGDPSLIDSALADLFAVQRLRSGYFAAPKMSSARAVRFANSVLDTVGAQVAVVPSSAVMGDVPAPSTAELEAHFKTYRDVERGQGEYGFGYRQPVGVKVEWITLNPSSIGAAVALDPIDVRKRYEARRDQYPGDFAAERENVRRDLRREKVAAIMADAEQEIRGRGLDDVQRYPADAVGMRTLPPDWRDARTSLEEIAEGVVKRVKDKHGVTIEPPFIGVQDGAWLTPDDFRQLPGLGRAFVRDGLRSIPLASALDQIREAMPEGASAAPRFQVGVLDRPAYDAAEQQHYFRFLDARRAGPPASIDEVRDEVARDLRRLRAYDALVERAASDAVRDALLARGARAGANAIDPGASETRVNVSEESAAPAGIGLGAELLTRVLGQDSFRDPVMQAARALDPLEPLDMQSNEARSLIVPVREALAVAFVRIVDRDPLTREEYEGLQAQIVAAAMQQELTSAGADNPFSFERMKHRLGYREVGSARRKTSETDNTNVDPDASEPARAANS